MRIVRGRDGYSHQWEVKVNGQEVSWIIADNEAGTVECWYYPDGKIVAYFPESDDPVPMYRIHGKVEIRKREV